MKILWIFLVLALGMISTAYGGKELDAAEVRDRVAAGEILPFQTIFDQQSARLTGKILDLEIEYEDHVLTYEVKLLQADGHVKEIYLNAKTGEILKEEIDD